MSVLVGICFTLIAIALVKRFARSYLWICAVLSFSLVLLFLEFSRDPIVRATHGDLPKAYSEEFHEGFKAGRDAYEARISQSNRFVLLFVGGLILTWFIPPKLPRKSEQAENTKPDNVPS